MVHGGRIVSAIQLTAGKQAIRFVLDDGTDVIARCEGDCCSITWIEHISLPAGGFPFVVHDASNIDMPDLGHMDGKEVVAYYGFQLVTDKGHAVIDYRNDSNGYYGGSLSWPGDSHCGGVYGQNDDDEPEWVDVAQDV